MHPTVHLKKRKWGEKLYLILWVHALTLSIMKEGTMVNTYNVKNILNLEMF